MPTCDNDRRFLLSVLLRFFVAVPRAARHGSDNCNVPAALPKASHMHHDGFTGKGWGSWESFTHFRKDANFNTLSGIAASIKDSDAAPSPCPHSRWVRLLFLPHITLSVSASCSLTQLYIALRCVALVQRNMQAGCCLPAPYPYQQLARRQFPPLQTQKGRS
ncbi:hypothetical protein GY45DRAFT_602207 [Cubamyces sp. BRFM 1775]|nr:hypothetical protein GY45DRAFT_602207 [Cubamyces sp. BRFM 1775]